MELNWREIGDRVASNEQIVVVPAGKRMKIESSPAGVDVLNELTPTGKTRSYFIRVTVNEEAT